MELTLGTLYLHGPLRVILADEDGRVLAVLDADGACAEGRYRPEYIAQAVRAATLAYASTCDC